MFRKHRDEIRADPQFVEPIFQAHLETASPGQLREMAAIYREQGMHDFAYDIELAADNRERGDFVELDS